MKKSTKKKPDLLTKQMSFAASEKIEAKLKKITKQLNLRSLSESIRHLIESY